MVADASACVRRGEVWALKCGSRLRRGTRCRADVRRSSARRRRILPCRALDKQFPIELPDWEVGAAEAAATVMRRIVGAGPDASVSEIADKWRLLLEAVPTPTAANMGACAAEVAVHSGDESEDTEIGALPPGLQGLRLPPPQFPSQQRHVRFDFNAIDVQEITPYEEVYGLHPREFVFDKSFHMVPAGGDYGFVDFLSACRMSARAEAGEDQLEEEDEVEDSDEDDEEQNGEPTMVTVFVISSEEKIEQ